MFDGGCWRQYHTFCRSAFLPGPSLILLILCVMGPSSALIFAIETSMESTFVSSCCGAVSLVPGKLWSGSSEVAEDGRW